MQQWLEICEHILHGRKENTEIKTKKKKTLLDGIRFSIQVDWMWRTSMKSIEWRSCVYNNKCVIQQRLVWKSHNFHEWFSFFSLSWFTIYLWLTNQIRNKQENVLFLHCISHGECVSLICVAQPTNFMTLHEKRILFNTEKKKLSCWYDCV